MFSFKCTTRLAVLYFVGTCASPLVAPTISWATSGVRPGEIVVLQAAGQDIESEVILSPLGEEGTTQSVTPSLVSNSEVFFQLPSNAVAGSYGVQLRAASGAMSNMWRLSDASVWWWQGDLGNASSPGGWLRMFGEGFMGINPNGTMIRLCPVSAERDLSKCSTLGKCQMLTADSKSLSMYQARFSMPSAMATGRYRLEVSNRGMSGFLAASSFTYRSNIDITPHYDEVLIRLPSAAWAQHDAPKVFNVQHYGASGHSYDDATPALSAALFAAAQAGGGIVYFPRGRYFIAAPVLVPGGTVLRGEATHLASIYFREYNVTSAPLWYMLGSSDLPWGLEDLSLYVTAYFGNHGSEASGGVLSLAGNGNFMRRVRVRANSFFGLEQENVAQRGRIFTWNLFQLGNLIGLGDARNFEVTDCDLWGQFVIFSTECKAASYGYVARNTIWNGAIAFRLCHANQVIFEDNQCSAVVDVGGGSDISNWGTEVASSSHLFIFNNTLRFTWGSDREATTFDSGGAGESGYTGKIAMQVGANITLASGNATFWNTPGSGNGKAIVVLDGPGAGQVRRIVRGAEREWELDSPLLGVSNDSLVQMANYRGQIIFHRNNYIDTGVLQLYAQAYQVVVAEHRFERTDGFVSIGVTEGAGTEPWNANCTSSPLDFNTNSMIQVLDSTVVESNHCWSWAASSQGGSEWDNKHLRNEFSFIAMSSNLFHHCWDGPMVRDIVFRRNHVVGYGGFGISDKVMGVLIEGNSMVNSTKTIYVNESADAVLLANNIVLEGHHSTEAFTDAVSYV